MPVEPAADRVAWPEVRARMRAFIARRVADPDVVEDLVQEVLVRLHEHLPHLRDQERLDAFAYRITRNVVIDHYRAAGSARERPHDGEAVLAWLDESAADEEPAGEDRAALARCLHPLVDRLPEPYREAVTMTDLGGVSQTEAARRLNLTVPGMKARVQRGRRQLGELLLECCEVVLDARGNVADHRRVGRCDCCGRGSGH